MSETKLKACAHCGRDSARLMLPNCRPDSPVRVGDRLFPTVRCVCGLEMPGDNEDYTGRSAIESWNQRAPGVVTEAITDDMVSRACVGFLKAEYDDEVKWNQLRPEYQARWRNTMRTILEHALDIHALPETPR